MPDILVEYRAEDGLAVIELNHPPANTYSYQMMRQLDEAILTARMDAAVHVLILRGNGEKFFSAGADINMLAGADPRSKYYFCLHANETLMRLEQTPKLVIAALNGHTVGGGLEIAMACDLRIGRRDAGRVGLPEVNLGVLPGTGGTQRLPRLVGRSRAIELMATGRTISFEEALEMHLIDDIFDRDEYWEQMLEYARQFVPPNKASKAVGHIKRAVCAAVNMPLAEGLAVERELQQRLFESPDAAAGIAAYVNKTVPRFNGV
jgi:enoyl-CoA hydratase